MKRRRRSDPVTDIVIVRTEDGKTFRCSIVLDDQGAEPRWVLMDESAEQFLGPPVLPDHSSEAVERQINEWWKERQGRSSTKPEARAK